MITSAKNYTKHTHTHKTDRQNPRTNGKIKAIQTKSHKDAYIYILRKREKGKNIYIKQKIKRKRATKSIDEYTSDNKL